MAVSYWPQCSRAVSHSVVNRSTVHYWVVNHSAEHRWTEHRWTEDHWAEHHWAEHPWIVYRWIGHLEAENRRVASFWVASRWWLGSVLECLEGVRRRRMYCPATACTRSRVQWFRRRWRACPPRKFASRDWTVFRQALQPNRRSCCRNRWAAVGDLRHVLTTNYFQRRKSRDWPSRSLTGPKLPCHLVAVPRSLWSHRLIDLLHSLGQHHPETADLRPTLGHRLTLAHRPLVAQWGAGLLKSDP